MFTHVNSDAQPPLGLIKRRAWTAGHLSFLWLKPTTPPSPSTLSRFLFLSHQHPQLARPLILPPIGPRGKPLFTLKPNLGQITDAILRESQRKLDLIKKRGATGVGWTRPSPPVSAGDAAASASASASASAPSPALKNNPPLHLLHEPAYSDDHATAAASSASPARWETDHRSHEDVHGSDAPPVQAALRGGGGGARTAGGGAEARRGAGARDDRPAAALVGDSSSGSPTSLAAEGIFGRENRHSSSASSRYASAPAPSSAPRNHPKRGGLNPVFNTERSDRSLGDLGVVVPVPATATGSGGRVPSFGVDMSALSGGGGDKLAAREADGAGDEEGWAPTPSPLIFGSHSIDAADRGGKGAAGRGTAGACPGRGSGGGGRRSEHRSSLGPATPVSPSKGPRYFTGGTPRHTPRQGPSHVWPLPKAAPGPAESEAVQEHVYDSGDDAAMPPVMVPLHRVAQGTAAPSTSSVSADSSESVGGTKDGKSAASGLAGCTAKKSTPPKKKLGGKAEYAMLFSGGNE